MSKDNDLVELKDKVGQLVCELKEKVEILEKVAVRLHVRLSIVEKKYKKLEGERKDDK